VPRDHDAARDLARINAGEQKKLPVPHGDDERMERVRAGDEVRRIGDARRGAENELDVAGGHGARDDLQRPPQTRPLPPQPRIFP
jgi:hypothetical protein